MNERALESDAGLTLIEILVTIVVVSIGVVGLVGALITAASGSSSSTTTTDNRSLLEAAAEQVQAATYAVSASSPACATPDYSAALAAVQRPVTAGGLRSSPLVSIAAVTYWNGTTFSSDCSYDVAPGAVKSRMQLVTLKSDNERLSFVKREILP